MKNTYQILTLSLLVTILAGCSVNGPDWQATEQDYQLAGLNQSTTNQPNQNSMTETNNTEMPAYNSATLKTNLGDITFTFYPESPKTVSNFIKLAEVGFYDGVKFHRVIKDFMIQTGDPNSKDDDWSNDGQGGPGYTFADEINKHPLVRGAVAMANSGPDTNGSQFFIVTAEATPWLNGKHTNFGQVTEGYPILNKIEEVKTNQDDHPLTDIIIEAVKLNK
ncbi:MAG: peptidylprolyl isomerase [Patescibacteria group bacterium]